MLSAIAYQRKVRIVGPTRIEMQTEHGAIGALLVISEGLIQFFEIPDDLHGGVSVRRFNRQHSARYKAFECDIPVKDHDD